MGMKHCERKEGIEPSLLFFFLILVLIFCNPGIVGCEEERERERCEPMCGC